MSYLGDFVAGASVFKKINTVDKTNGAPITLAGTPAVSVYKNGSTTESTTGVTLTVDFDGRTGTHHILVDTSADGTFYAAGNDFQIVITAGTVDSTSVVGTVVAEFSIESRNIKADVRQFGGTNGTFAAGRPEVNVTHSRGTALATPTVAGIPKVEVASYSTNQDPGTWVRDMPDSGAVSIGTLGYDIKNGFVAANSVDQKLTTARAGYLDSINTGLTLAGTQAFNNTGTWTGNRIGNLTGSVGSVASGVTVTTNNDKTGYTATVSDKTGFKLASDGLDSIAVSAPTTVATTFPGMMVQVWRRFFKKVTKTSTQIRTYADDGTTVTTTATVSDDGTTQTQGPAT